VGGAGGPELWINPMNTATPIGKAGAPGQAGPAGTYTYIKIV
jgi:hypothetical protein